MRVAETGENGDSRTRKVRERCDVGAWYQVKLESAVAVMAAVGDGAQPTPLEP